MASFFSCGAVQTKIEIQAELPSLDKIHLSFENCRPQQTLIIADQNTVKFAERIKNNTESALCIIKSGEVAKNWTSVEKMLAVARAEGLGRDALFIGVGGGVLTDLAGFAASIYMRGVRLALVPTTLLSMVDAAIGGKTGIDLFNRKNLAGTFYPAQLVIMPVETLATLPATELKSGCAELIKTVILSTIENEDAVFKEIRTSLLAKDWTALSQLIGMAVNVKARIVEADPYETGSARALLNLGHTFGHALEATAGLGTLSHGEAVAWGICRACELGVRLGKTPPERAAAIVKLLQDTGYETHSPHPAMADADLFMAALKDDKKKSKGAYCFIVPSKRGAEIVQLEHKELIIAEDIALVKKTVL